MNVQREVYPFLRTLSSTVTVKSFEQDAVLDMEIREETT